MGRLKAGWTVLQPGLARFWRHLYRGAAAYVVLLIALLLTGLAYYYVRQNVEAVPEEVSEPKLVSGVQELFV